MDIGLEKENRKAIADALSRALADTMTLYVKTLGFHWNVTGSNFYALHELFKKLYEDLMEGGDTIAERIRTLGHQAPCTFSEFSALSAVKDGYHHGQSATDIVRQLILDNELVVRRLKEMLDIAQTNKDDVTVGILTMRMEIHSKAAWMLRSHLE